MSTPNTSTLEIDAPITLPDDSPMRAQPDPQQSREPERDADEPADIMDFEFDDFADAEPEPEPERRPEPKPVEERKIVDVEPEPAQADGDVVPAEGSSALREQVIAANDRARSAAARQAELEAEIASLREERDGVTTRLKQQTDAITGIEAASHPDVRAIEAPWEQRFKDFANSLDDTGGDSQKLRDMGAELLAMRQRVGDRGTEGFEDRLADYRSKLEDEFPEHWREVATMVGEGMRVGERVRAKIAEVTQNAESFRYDTQRRQYADMVKRYEQIEQGFGQVPLELLESDPGHQRVILHNLIESIPSLKERGSQVKSYLRRVNMPLAPLDPAQLAGMSEADQNAHLQERVQRYEQDRLEAVSASWDNYMWRSVGPVLHRLLKEAQGRSATIAKSTPAPRDHAADQSARLTEDEFKTAAEFEIDPNPLGD